MAEIESIDSQIENLISALAAGSKTTNQYINQRIAVLDQRRSELNNKIVSIKSESNSTRIQAAYIEDIMDRVEDIIQGGSFEEQKALAHAVIQSVTLHVDKGIDIVYCI